MTRKVKELAQEMLKLDEESRASLALILLQSLEGTVPSQVDSDRPLRPRFGSAGGLIEMADDFDEPLEDFKVCEP